jgi:FkbM family methyltransferase
MRAALLKRKILNAGALWISYIKLIPWLLRLNKDSIVLDCGANIGGITLYLSVTGATIYAFEPDPLAFKILSERCSNKKNITCINTGVWDKKASIKLYRHHEMKYDEASFTTGSSIIANKKNVDADSSYEIEVIDLVNFILQLNKKVDLVKIDIEGAETEILKKIITEDAHSLFNTMYVETHETKIPGQAEELNDIKKQMKEKGITNIKLNWV